ncbi:alpha/beta hydrolase fold domain-containing protein [Escherichia coli]
MECWRSRNGNQRLHGSNTLWSGRDSPPAPKSHSPATLFYLHGGGFILGNLDSHDRIMRLLANYTECTVIGNITLFRRSTFSAGNRGNCGCLLPLPPAGGRLSNQHVPHWLCR